MSQIIEFVGQTLLRAIPTFFIVFFLYLYLKRVLLRPLGDVLEKRRQATEGAIAQAEALVARAAEKMAAYEKGLADARAEIYQENEAWRARLQAEQSAAVQQARGHATAAVVSAKAGLAKEAEASRSALDAESERLAEQIAQSLLMGRTA